MVIVVVVVVMVGLRCPSSCCVLSAWRLRTWYQVRSRSTAAVQHASAVTTKLPCVLLDELLLLLLCPTGSHARAAYLGVIFVYTERARDGCCDDVTIECPTMRQQQSSTTGTLQASRKGLSCCELLTYIIAQL